MLALAYAHNPDRPIHEKQTIGGMLNAGRNAQTTITTFDDTEHVEGERLLWAAWGARKENRPAGGVGNYGAVSSIDFPEGRGLRHRNTGRVFFARKEKIKTIA